MTAEWVAKCATRIGRHRREVTEQDRRNDWADATSGRPIWAGKHRATGETS